MTITPLIAISGLATAYAAVLDRLERRLPIHPRYIWLEVVGGVLITVVPVMIARRANPMLSARDYERLIIAGFVASGTPIILWQLIRYRRTVTH